jgi:hypothetical protein
MVSDGCLARHDIPGNVKVHWQYALADRRQTSRGFFTYQLPCSYHDEAYQFKRDVRHLMGSINKNYRTAAIFLVLFAYGVSPPPPLESRL